SCMNKRTVLLLSIVLLSVMARAQLSITLQVPPVGVLMKNQLWNMTIINTSNSSITAMLVMTMYDVKTNQPVLSATVSPIILDRGAKQIQAKDLSPILYTYESAGITDRDPNGMLPIGEFRVCYTLNGGLKNTLAAENCIQLAVDPLSPPLLNTPADEARIYTSSPQFTWLPPTPVSMFSDLSYDLILVEVLPGQATADAIQQNVPIYSGGFIRNQYLNYASSYTSLDTGRLYAWRIVALNSGQPAAMSDIWTFKVVTPPKPSKATEYTSYLELHRGLDASMVTAGSSLDITYDNAAADSVVHYTISGIQDAGNPVIQKGTLSFRRGQNWLTVPLTTGAYRSDRLYLFQFVNGRNETWNIKFTPASK
ncbi:MAG TPA: hypothetical protein VG605_19140, partial [Puia sp.]|nr:hypothetical protein [Puia sp.]